MNGRLDSKKVTTYILLGCLLLLVVLQFVDIKIFTIDISNILLENTFIHLLGGVVFIIVGLELGYKIFSKETPFFSKALILVIPALIVSIYNFPFSAYIQGTAYRTMPFYPILLFISQSFSIAFFEEILFRGIVLMFFVKKLGSTRRGLFDAIVYSSFLFGMIHLFNLFTGSHILSVLMQIGYSFLVGMMWSVVYLKTKNIWYVIILHAIYNFTGYYFYTLGYIEGQWDVFTIISTTLIALGVIWYMWNMFLSIEIKTS